LGAWDHCLHGKLVFPGAAGCIVTITSGLLAYSLPLFVLLSFLTRGGRFFFIAVLPRYYGESINGLLDKYFGWFLAILALAIVVGFWIAARDLTPTMRLKTPFVLALAILAVAVLSIAGAFIFEALGYAPCELCLKERIPYYVASPLAGLAALFATSGRKPLLRSAERGPWRLSRRPRMGILGRAARVQGRAQSSSLG
jgi:Disulfide bond formation protein DsbB